MKLTLILGNQLFDPSHFKRFPENVFMAEDRELCTHFKYHKHKIIHFLCSMRIYSEQLRTSGLKVHYFDLMDRRTYIEKLREFIQKNNVLEIHLFEIEDKFFEKKILDLFTALKLKVNINKSPMFMCTREEFSKFLKTCKKPLLNNFYIEMRKKNKILMRGDKPIGGAWNFDKLNRKKIPKKFMVTNFVPPLVNHEKLSKVKALVDREFSSHPGKSEDFWIPLTRKDSKQWLSTYLDERFLHFGDFQDSIDSRNPFLYHSLLSPLINIGFLTPNEVILEVEKRLNDKNLSAVEGFIRQVLGWREFVRGIYQNYDEFQQNENFFDHKNTLRDCWYRGDTGVAPLDEAIKKTLKWGYCHHIERLMIIGNIMLLLEVSPKEVYRWFMEMYVDSSDWVMGPNVFGMSQFSDGGIFATKPYISGSNYILKMSHFKKNEPWAEAWDGLYWRFIERKKEFLKKNHRLNMMVSMLEKMDPVKKASILKLGAELEKKLVINEGCNK